MAISFIGEASAIADNVGLPGHQAGDLIVIFAYRSTSAVAPTMPAGFTSINSGAGNTNGHAAGYKIAASSAESSGSWTNAEIVAVEVYRGAQAVAAQAQVTNVANILIPALTLTVTDGSSWVGAFAGCRSGAQPIESPPPGLTLRTDTTDTSAREAVAFDTNGGVSSWAQQTGGSTGGNRFRALSYEIVATPSAAAIAGSASITERKDSASSIAQMKIAASAAKTEGRDGVSSASALRLRGAASATEGRDTLASTGSSAQPGINANLSLTERRDGVSSASSVKLAAAGDINEKRDGIAASASIASAQIIANLSIQEQRDTVVSTGRTSIKAAMVRTEARDGLSANGASGDYPTPVDRIATVPAERRVLSVLAEIRSVSVYPETRSAAAFE